MKIAVIDNIIEAQMIQAALDAEAIPHRLRSYHDTAYDGLFQFQKGYGEILAPEEFKRNILEIIAAIKAPDDALLDRQPPEDPDT